MPAFRHHITPVRMTIAALVTLLAVVAALTVISQATAWDPLRSRHAAVEMGNQAMQKENAKSALVYYDKAAKALPDSPGVHFNRGLALRLTQDDTKAQQAFATASQLRGQKPVRSEAFYNLGIGEYQRGDAQLGKKAFKEAQQAFKDAAEAFKQALRVSPGHKHAAWNLELALRQLDKAREQEKQQKQEQGQKKQPDKSDASDESSKPNPDNDKAPESAPRQSDQESAQATPDQPSKPDSQPKDTKEQPPVLPSEAERVLDTLQQREENLERHKARIRALHENRRPTKDW